MESLTIKQGGVGDHKLLDKEKAPPPLCKTAIVSGLFCLPECHVIRESVGVVNTH